jgi:hypothetical protein
MRILYCTVYVISLSLLERSGKGPAAPMRAVTHGILLAAGAPFSASYLEVVWVVEQAANPFPLIEYKDIYATKYVGILR